jgi:hypothetical protein
MTRFLNQSAANRATTRTADRVEISSFIATERQHSPRERADYVKRELTLDSCADAALTELVTLFRDGTNARMTTSHVARALLRVIALCRPQLEREARRLGPLRLPSNARGRELQRDEFERRIAEAILTALRSEGRVTA